MLQEKYKEGHAHTEEKEQLERRGCGWYDIKMEFKGIRFELVD
jgi:hypothetical protein